MRKIIVAIDSFKGCLTSAEANQAASEGILQGMPEAEVVKVPVSDGGEGWLEAFHTVMERERPADATDCGAVSADGRYGSDRDSQGQRTDAAQT